MIFSANFENFFEPELFLFYTRDTFRRGLRFFSLFFWEHENFPFWFLSSENSNRMVNIRTLISEVSWCFKSLLNRSLWCFVSLNIFLAKLRPDSHVQSLAQCRTSHVSSSVSSKIMQFTYRQLFIRGSTWLDGLITKAQVWSVRTPAFIVSRYSRIRLLLNLLLCLLYPTCTTRKFYCCWNCAFQKLTPPGRAVCPSWLPKNTDFVSLTVEDTSVEWKLDTDDLQAF